MRRQRAWNTWDATYPACFVHLPSGVAVRVSAYSTRERRHTDFPFDTDAVRLGPHASDGSYAELELTHAGSRLRVRFATADEDTAVGDLEVLETAEWGLRFWYLLKAGLAGDAGGAVELLVPEGTARYVEPPVATGAVDGTAFAFGPAVRPFGADRYADRRTVGEDLERRGYYFRPREEPADARWAVFRFNAVIPRVPFAAAVGGDPRETRERVRRVLADVDRVLMERAAACARPSWRRAAIRDVVAWNTVWDPVNGRPYTASTRGWVNERFGGWIVWQLDAFFAALLAAHVGDFETAQANLDAALDCRTPDGNLCALRSGLTDWVDRSHPPIGAQIAWALYRRTLDRGVLERCYPILARAFDWWFRARDGNGNGILEYGSSPVGEGHFVHTKLAAMDEAAMDNSPVHDEATFDLGTHTLDMEDVGLNSLLVVEGELLARIADELGLPDEAGAVRERSADLAEGVRSRLWDPERNIFANRLWDGRFARSLAPTSFYPMLAGIASREQAETMVREHLTDPRRFWSEYPVAGTPQEDPASLDNVYWRGRVWPCLNFLVYRALRRYRFDEVASELAARSVALFERHWADRRSYENLNQRTGEGGDTPDSEAFYSFGALLPLIGEMELIDVDPWDGLVFGVDGTEPGAAELPTGAGRYRVEVDGRGTRLFLEDDLLVEASVRGRFRDLRASATEIALEVPPVPDGGRIRIGVPGRVERVMVGDEPVRLRVAAAFVQVDLPPAPEGRRLRADLRPGGMGRDA